MTLTPQQNAQLLAGLDPKRVQHKQGQAHLTAWDVRRWLIRIFGVGGWDDEILSCELVYTWSGEVPKKDKQGKPTGQTYLGHTVIYRVTMRLIVKDPDGNEVTHFDDGACGDSVNQPSLGDAHDNALKTALSQALKRCAVNLGDQFGLSLYNNGNPAPVVARSLTMPTDGAQPEAHQEDAPVLGDSEADQPDERPPPPRTAPMGAAAEVREQIRAFALAQAWDLHKVADAFLSDRGQALKTCDDPDVLLAFLDDLKAEVDAAEAS